MFRFLMISFILNTISHADVFDNDKSKPLANKKIDWQKKAGEKLIIDLQNNKLKRLAMEKFPSRDSKQTDAKKVFFLKKFVKSHTGKKAYWYNAFTKFMYECLIRERMTAFNSLFIY